MRMGGGPRAWQQSRTERSERREYLMVMPFPHLAPGHLLQVLIQSHEVSLAQQGDGRRKRQPILVRGCRRLYLLTRFIIACA